MSELFFPQRPPNVLHTFLSAAVVTGFVGRNMEKLLIKQDIAAASLLSVLTLHGVPTCIQIG
jgi:hypothetical protein